jgi:hypothetical protein
VFEYVQNGFTCIRKGRNCQRAVVYGDLSLPRNGVSRFLVEVEGESDEQTAFTVEHLDSIAFAKETTKYHKDKLVIARII